MRRKLRLAWAGLHVVLATTVCGTLCILAALVDWRKRSMWLYSKLWSRWILWSTGLKVQLKGRERLTRGARYIYVANHSSALDILLAFAILPGSICFMAKRELFRIPFFGWTLWAAGCIPVDRSNRAKAVRSVERTLQQLARTRLSLALYPEGTRSRTGELQPFKRGGFVLAIRSGLAVVPVVTAGSFQALPPDRLYLTQVPLHLTIGDPIETQNLTVDDGRQLLTDIRSRMEAMLGPPD